MCLKGMEGREGVRRGCEGEGEKKGMVKDMEANCVMWTERN